MTHEELVKDMDEENMEVVLYIGLETPVKCSLPIVAFLALASAFILTFEMHLSI